VIEKTLWEAISFLHMINAFTGSTPSQCRFEGLIDTGTSLSFRNGDRVGV